jgi:hypothetical protein
MAKIYKTAMGKSVDIDSVRISNENEIAIGNMKVNARGDKLGPGGQVIQNRNQVMDQHYRMHSPVAGNSDQMVQQQIRQGADVAQGQAFNPVPVPDIDPSGESFDPPQDPVPSQPQMRGSLADSIAREVTVTQDLLTPPNKNKGPSRI